MKAVSDENFRFKNIVLGLSTKYSVYYNKGRFFCGNESSRYYQ